MIKDLRNPGLINQGSIYNDVEYEKIVKDLRENTKNKYSDREDLNKFITDEDDINTTNDVTFLLMPGMLLNYENSQSDTNPYPVSDAMYSNGLPWSDY